MEEVKTTKKTAKTKSPVKIFQGVGRRKDAVARVWLSKGTGKTTVNNLDIDKYFDTEVTRLDAVTPFKVCPELASSFNVKVNIFGGGKVAQAGAVRLGISRALLDSDPELRQILRKNKLLTVDSRIKERKKYGQKGARAKFQFTKR